MKTKMAILSSLLAGVLFWTGCTKGVAKDVVLGNTNANISNGGLSVMKNDWIYFMNYEKDSALYKIKIDGTGETLVTEDQAFYLNCVEDWIYYCHGGDGNKIYKMRLDGTERSLVSEVKAGSVLVADGWIYFADFSNADNAEEFGRIFKIRTDGSSRQKVSRGPVQAMNLTGSWLYYLHREEEKLYRVKTDGTAEEKVSDAKMSSFQILGKSLYYVDATDGKNELWTMTLEGKEPKRLTTDKVTAFNAAGEWIYYGNTKGDSPDLELKKMKLDGSEAQVVNDDDPVSIMVFGDFLVYLGMDFTNFSLKETILKADGSLRKDYIPVQTSPTEDVVHSGMREVVKGQNMDVQVLHAYATNIAKNEEPQLQAAIYDRVEEGMFFFLNLQIILTQPEALDLKGYLGVIEEMGDGGYSVYWPAIADISKQGEKNKISFHLPFEAYKESFTLEPETMKDIQLYLWLGERKFPVFLGLFNGDDINPLAIIEVMPDEAYYVTSWGDAEAIMKQKFPDAEVSQRNGMGYKFPGEAEEQMYYTFEVREKGSAAPVSYLVQRNTGMIYIGGNDPAYPDYPVPVAPLE